MTTKTGPVNLTLDLGLCGVCRRKLPTTLPELGQRCDDCVSKGKPVFRKENVQLKMNPANKENIYGESLIQINGWVGVITEYTQSTAKVDFPHQSGPKTVQGIGFNDLHRIAGEILRPRF